MPRSPVAISGAIPLTTTFTDNAFTPQSNVRPASQITPVASSGPDW